MIIYLCLSSIFSHETHLFTRYVVRRITKRRMYRLQKKIGRGHVVPNVSAEKVTA